MISGVGPSQNRPKIDPGGDPKIKLQKKRQKSEGATPKSGFLGPGADFGIYPGAPKITFWPTSDIDPAARRLIFWARSSPMDTRSMYRRILEAWRRRSRGSNAPVGVANLLYYMDMDWYKCITMILFVLLHGLAKWF